MEHSSAQTADTPPGNWTGATSAAALPNKLGRFNWRHFLWLNVLSVLGAALAIELVFSADRLLPAAILDSGTAAIASWFFDHPAWTTTAAVSPLLVSLLVGWGYSQRAKKRRAAEAARAARKAAKNPIAVSA